MLGFESWKGEVFSYKRKIFVTWPWDHFRKTRDSLRVSKYRAYAIMADQILSRGSGLIHNDVMYRGVMNILCGFNTVSEAVKRSYQRTREYWNESDTGNRWHFLKDMLTQMVNIGRGVFRAYQGVRELKQIYLV